jgi:hypothetical protein
VNGSLVSDHIKAIGLTHPVIHEVNYAEEVFKGDFFFEEVLNMMQNELDKEKIQREEEEKRRIAKE